MLLCIIAALGLLAQKDAIEDIRGFGKSEGQCVEEVSTCQLRKLFSGPPSSQLDNHSLRIVNLKSSQRFIWGWVKTCPGEHQNSIKELVNRCSSL